VRRRQHGQIGLQQHAQGLVALLQRGQPIAGDVRQLRLARLEPDRAGNIAAAEIALGLGESRSGAHAPGPHQRGFLLDDIGKLRHDAHDLSNQRVSLRCGLHRGRGHDRVMRHIAHWDPF
jgi:hypothetical protein